MVLLPADVREMSSRFSSEKMAGHAEGEMEPRPSLTMQNKCAKMRLLLQSETRVTRKNKTNLKGSPLWHMQSGTR